MYDDLYFRLLQYRVADISFQCLFTYSGVQHIVLCRVFVLFFFVSYALCCQFLWIVHFWMGLRYSLIFIYTYLIFTHSPLDLLFLSLSGEIIHQWYHNFDLIIGFNRMCNLGVCYRMSLNSPKYQPVKSNKNIRQMMQDNCH